jgi:hypothetical protein
LKNNLTHAEVEIKHGLLIGSAISFLYWISATALKLESVLARFDKDTERKSARRPIAPLNKVTPPLNAEFLFHVFMTPQSCDALLGDLEERYKLINKKFGRRRANLWYWTQTVTSLAPIVWAWAKKIPMKPVAAVVGWAIAKGMIGHDGWLAVLVEMVKKVRS